MMLSSEETKIATDFSKASNMEEVGDIIYELSTMKLQSQFEFEEDTRTDRNIEQGIHKRN